MTDLRELAESQIGALTEIQKAEFTPDDLRTEIEKLRNRLCIVETDRDAERQRANKYMDKCQTTAAALFDLMEGEIVACFTGLLEDLGDNPEFERRIEGMIEDGLNNAGALNDEDVTNQIDDYLDNSDYEPTGSASFDAAVRDVVREMITDGDIVLSIDVS